MGKAGPAGKKGATRYAFEGKQKIAAYAPAAVFPGRVWGVVITVPLEDLQKVLLTQNIDRTFFQFNLTMLGIIILVFILLQFFEVRWLFKPLSIMNASLKKISEGDLSGADFHSAGGAKDEFGQLAQNLKSALSNLRQKTVNVDAVITQKTQALEQKITELETANKVMAGRELKMMELKKEIEELKKSK